MFMCGCLGKEDREGSLLSSFGVIPFSPLLNGLELDMSFRRTVS